MAAWAITIGFALLSIVCFDLHGFSMDAQMARPIVAFILLGCVLGLILLLRDAHFPLGAACGGIMQQALCGCAAIWLECVAAQNGAPFIDAWSMSFDAALGYDWRAYAAFISAHPALSTMLGWAYLSLLYQSAGAVFLLGLLNTPRMSLFIMANTLVLIITIAIFTLAPETTPWIHAHATSAETARLGLPTVDWVQTLRAIRSGDLLHLSGQADMAVVGFPSYHCSGALLILWALWPLRPLRYVLVPVNLALIASTPFFGGHYVADVVVAPFIVALSIAGSKQIMAIANRRAEYRPKPRFAAAAIAGV